MSAVGGAAVQPTEVDVGENLDSALGDDESTYTETLRSSILESLRGNGRGYHKYRDGHYNLPEDEREQERLDLQHAMFLRTFQNKLYLAPISEPISAALDLGTGTGIWAIDFADQHPETNVVGVDLSPIQPTGVPINCKFEVDDFDTDWTFKKKFDYIHGRVLTTSSADFPELFRRAFDSLQPGGWFEMQDLHMPIFCDDDSMKGTEYQKWNELYMEACLKLGRDPSWSAKYKDWMMETGFDNVEEHQFKWPVNTWPKDQNLKELGKWNLVNMLDGLEGFTIRLWTKMLGMSVSEIEAILGRVRQDLRNTKIHSYWRVYVVYGRKPKDAAP